jgi:hypothetical protein
MFPEKSEKWKENWEAFAGQQYNQKSEKLKLKSEDECVWPEGHMAVFAISPGDYGITIVKENWEEFISFLPDEETYEFKDYIKELDNRCLQLDVLFEVITKFQIHLGNMTAKKYCEEFEKLLREYEWEAEEKDDKFILTTQWYDGRSEDEVRWHPITDLFEEMHIRGIFPHLSWCDVEMKGMQLVLTTEQLAKQQKEGLKTTHPKIDDELEQIERQKKALEEREKILKEKKKMD